MIIVLNIAIIAYCLYCYPKSKILLNQENERMRNLSIILIISTIIISSSCSILKHSEHTVFDIKNAYYQSWMIKDQKKGTDVIIELINVDPEIEFLEIVFRGIKVNISKSTNANTTVIKGVINTGPSVIENYEYEVSGSHNSIKYKYKDEYFTIPVKNFQRLKTKFL